MTDPEDRSILKSSWDSTGRFAPHGEFTLHSEGRVLCYDAVGPFNLEGIEALRTTRIKTYEKWQSNGTFTAIVHWHHSALMSPEAFDAYREGYLQFMRDRQPSAVVAWVAAPGVEGMGLMLKKFEDVFRLTNTRFCFFSDLGAAQSWIEASQSANTTNT